MMIRRFAIFMLFMLDAVFSLREFTPCYLRRATLCWRYAIAAMPLFLILFCRAPLTMMLRSVEPPLIADDAAATLITLLTLH